MSFREELLRPLWNQVRHTGNQIYHMISEHPVETMLQMERWYIKAPYIGKLSVFFPWSLDQRFGHLNYYFIYFFSAYILNFPFTLWTDPLRCIIPLLMVSKAFF